MLSYLFNVTKYRNTTGNENNSLLSPVDSNNYASVDDEASLPTVTSSVVRWNLDDAIDTVAGTSLLASHHGRLFAATALLFLVDSMELSILAYLSRTVDAQVDWYHDEYLYTAGIGGAAVGAIVWGTLGDQVGRRPVAIGVAALVTVCGVLSALCCANISALANTTTINTTDTTSNQHHHYQGLIVQGLLWSRALVGFGLGGITVPYDLLAEWLPNQSASRTLRRGQVLLLVHTFWSLGSLLIFALLETDTPFSPQRGQLTGSIELGWCILPALMATLLLLTGDGILESPRWYLSQGQPEKALEVLKRAARANGVYPSWPTDETVTMVLYTNESSSSSSSSMTSSPMEQVQCPCPDSIFGSLFSYQWFSLASSLLFTYFGQSFCHQGTAAMLVQTFEDNNHDQTYQAVLSAVSEGLGIVLLLFLIDPWGRVPTQIMAYALAALACLTLAVWYALPFLENGNVLIALTLVARMLVFGGGSTTWVSTTEVLTTSIRAQGHAVAAGMVGRLGAFVSTVTLPRVHDIPTVALIVFAGCMWITLCAGDIPETRRNELGRSYNLLGHSERWYRGHGWWGRT